MSLYLCYSVHAHDKKIALTNAELITRIPSLYLSVFVHSPEVGIKKRLNPAFAFTLRVTVVTLEDMK